MTAIAQSVIDKIIERKYTSGITEIGYGKSTPLWSWMPKMGDFYESTLELRNQYGLSGGGHSSLVTQARLYSGASTYGNFTLTQSEAFASVQFGGRTLRAIIAANSKRQIGIVSLEVKNAMRGFGRRMNRMMWGNAGGAICRISSGGNGQVITVNSADRTLLNNIWPGMYLVSSNTDGTSGSVDANPTHVSGVDPVAGTITTDATTSWDTAAGGFSNGDYLFAAGDFGAAFFGVQNWVPSSAPSDTFLGQNRALNPTYLGGVRYTAAAGDPDGTIVRALNNAAVEGSVHGAEPTACFMNTLDYGKLLNEVEGRVEYEAAKLPARKGAYDETDLTVDAGITGVRVSVMGNASMVVVPDPDCPRNLAYMLDERTFAFHGVGQTEPEWLNHTGQGKWRNMVGDNVDGMEALAGIYGNLGCDAPGCNIVVDLTLVL